MPGQVEENQKVQIPGFGEGGLANLQRDSDPNTSGRQSSKRDGIGRLNINKAVAIQQEQLQKTENALSLKQKGIQDVEDGG